MEMLEHTPIIKKGTATTRDAYEMDTQTRFDHTVSQLACWL